MWNVGTRVSGGVVLVVVALLNQACEPVPSSPPDGVDTDDRCAYGGGTFHQARSAGLTLTRLIVDNHGLATTFNPNGVYDGEPAACFDDAANTAALIFEVDGSGYGRIVVGADSPGSIELGGNEGTLIIDLFGEDDPAVFTKTQFVTGSWLVDRVSPSLQTDVFGDAQRDGRFLSITFAADVRP